MDESEAYLKQELQNRLGFPEVADIAKYLLAIDNTSQLQSHLNEYLGDEGAATEIAIKIAQLRQDSASNKPGLTRGARVHVINAGTSVDVAPEKKVARHPNIAKNRGRDSRVPAQPSGLSSTRSDKPERKSANRRTKGKAKSSTGSQDASTSNSKSKKLESRNLELETPGKDGFVDFETALLAEINQDYTNCLTCGKIQGVRDRDLCVFCGTKLREGYSLYGLDTDPVQSELSPEDSCKFELRMALEAAVALKNKLLKFDEESAQRTTVIDDLQDYRQNAHSSWLSHEEAAEEERKAEEKDAQDRDRGYKITLDFSGRRVLMDENLSTSTGGNSHAQGSIRNKDAARTRKPDISQHEAIDEQGMDVNDTSHLHGQAKEVHDAITHTLQPMREKAEENRKHQESSGDYIRPVDVIQHEHL